MTRPIIYYSLIHYYDNEIDSFWFTSIWHCHDLFALLFFCLSALYGDCWGTRKKRGIVTINTGVSLYREKTICWGQERVGITLSLNCLYEFVTYGCSTVM